MSIKVGSKMLYCKIAGDKSSEEVVEIVAVDAEVGGVTIYIPSLKRERDTELSRLAKLSVEQLAQQAKDIKRRSEEREKLENMERMKELVKKADDFICSNVSCFKSKPEVTLFEQVLNLHQADEVLLDNQRLLFNQLNSLKESLKVLIAKKPVDSIVTEEIKELRRLNTSLLLNQQVMAKELAESKKEIQEMRAEMALFRQFIPTVKAVPITNPMVLGTKF